MELELLGVIHGLLDGQAASYGLFFLKFGLRNPLPGETEIPFELHLCGFPLRCGGLPADRLCSGQQARSGSRFSIEHRSRGKANQGFGQTRLILLGQMDRQAFIE